ncbi:General secretion pathway protein M [Granulibacter bethesdensis]|uniref:General secretion pathway protein M n=1 Tax=Granulibacter bethesdensis TaxID=364410 RepID=A0AAC9K892_9PROT|nr:type II secretion system protein GspM [Granulibacter bethesdensis]APH55075.1 General secretion pathway protein M [Granulibacter bethesdensis]APH62661.1 General secretion pathway protein M [Granulibacter bethesdensis]
MIRRLLSQTGTNDSLQLPTGRTGQLCALGLALLAVGGTWLGIIAPLLGWYAARQYKIEDRTTLLAHMQGAVASLPALQQTRTLMQRGDAANTIFLQSPNDAANAAQIQETLRALSQQTGVSLLSVETLPSDTLGAYRKISLRLSVRGSWPAIIALIAGLGEASPQIIADEIQMHASVAGAIKPADVGYSPPIDMTMTVSALAVVPSSHQAPP